MNRLIKAIEPLADKALEPLIRQAPVIGTCYGFSKTARKVYNSTSPSHAMGCAIKGIVIDCTPPFIKYPALCTELAACCVASFSTGGNPSVVSATIFVADTIVECALGE